MSKTQFPTREVRSKLKVSDTYQRWWISDESKVAADLIQLVRTIEENQRDQYLQDQRHAYLYNNHQSANSTIAGQPSLDLPERFHVTYNVVKSAIDTVTARIAQKELRPRVLTERGDYAKQQRAMRLTKYLDGLLDSGGVYKIGPQILKDACIFGTGVVKVIADPETQEVRFERTLVKELLVDDLEAKYGDPKSMYQRRLVSKDTLLEQFPDCSDEIEAAATARENPLVGFSTKVRRAPVVDMVEVIEGWHLGVNGRHVIAIEGKTLIDQPWSYKTFPFAFLRYNPKIESFYGQGIAEELLGTQLEINKLLRDIQRAQHLVAVPRLLIERHSKIIPQHINNDIGSAIKYEGTRPDFITPSAMSNEIYSHVKWLISSAYEKVGVSILSATSVKPSGLDSKPALREFSNIESGRFAVTEMAYQELFKDIAELAVKWSRELYKNSKDIKVTTQSKKFIETISWSDVDLEDDKFVTKMYVSSLLPTSPSARLQKIEEYVRAGWMDRETALSQFNHPDVEAWETTETAEKDFVALAISDILEHGRYRAPEPEIDPLKAVNFAKKAYLEAIQNGAPVERVELLLRWIDAAASLLPDIAQPVAPDLGLPSAAPMPLPQSGILPQG